VNNPSAGILARIHPCKSRLDCADTFNIVKDMDSFLLAESMKPALLAREFVNFKILKAGIGTQSALNPPDSLFST
jgi:hypothetical protein